MCGIFGYIGKRENASNVVLEGLKLLEYRGYDSWGVAAQFKAKRNDVRTRFIHEKHIGKIGGALLDPKFDAPNSIAIGHTRWATHGGVTDENAHPQFDCERRVAVIQNGIVENYQELKTKLISKGHKFRSNTDTEVIAHLIEDSLNQNRPFREAVSKAFNKLKGLNAIVVINTLDKEIIAAKNGSPLIAGIGNGEYLISSDTSAILPFTKKVIFLRDNELISLNKIFKVYDLETGAEKIPAIETIDWKFEQANKGKFEHFMLKEIYDQPIVINNIANTYGDQIEQIAEAIKKARGTYFIGSGTASYACLAGTYLFSKIAHRHVNTAPASEFNYLEDFITKDSLIIPLSQSGETIDVIEPLSHVKKKGSKIVAITNVLGSTVYRMGDYKLLLGAGPEMAVASTKAFIAKIAILTMLSYSLADKPDEAKGILNKSVKVLLKMLDKKQMEKIKDTASFLAAKEHIYIIGRGVSYAAALEGALKIKETSYIHAEGLAGGELKHGTIALISKGTPVIVIAPKDETFDAIISNAIEIKTRGGYIIGISSENNPAFDTWIEVTETGAPLITHVVLLQILAYFIAVKKGLDPDKPRNLAKSVTVK